MKVNPQCWCCKFSKTLESHEAGTGSCSAGAGAPGHRTFEAALNYPAAMVGTGKAKKKIDSVGRDEIF